MLDTFDKTGAIFREGHASAGQRISAGKAQRVAGRFGGQAVRVSALGSRIGASIERSFANLAQGQIKQFNGFRKGGFDVRGPQWMAALMLPFLVVIMMAVVTVIYQAVIEILVSLGLTNVGFLWFIQSIAGLGLLVVGVWVLIKWTETGGFGIFRWT